MHVLNVVAVSSGIVRRRFLVGSAPVDRFTDQLGYFSLFFWLYAITPAILP